VPGQRFEGGDRLVGAIKRYQQVIVEVPRNTLHAMPRSARTPANEAVKPTASSELCTVTVSHAARNSMGHPRRSASVIDTIAVVPSLSVITAITPSPRPTGPGRWTTVTGSTRRSIRSDESIEERSVSPGMPGRYRVAWGRTGSKRSACSMVRRRVCRRSHRWQVQG
jgi:hypothetical protein